jgi:hypothetical protein
MHMPDRVPDDMPDRDDADIEVWAMPLRIPSSCPSEASSDLVEIEIALRKAQADDALFNLRHLLRYRFRMLTFKRRQVDGTGNAPQTRARGVLDSYRRRIDETADTYRAARCALMALATSSVNVPELRSLTSLDIQGPVPDTSMDTRQSEGYFRPSWIWSVPSVNRDREDKDELRHEWVRMKARKERWDEEQLLLLEEMRRTVQFLKWKAHWWCDRTSRRVVDDDKLRSGLYAYPLRQSDMLLTLADLYQTKWNGIIVDLGLSPIGV